MGQVAGVLFFGYRSYGVRNVPRSGPVILASNHQSFIDPVVVGVALTRRIHSMARGSLFRTPFLGYMIRWLSAFPLERGAPDIKAMRQALKVLANGRQLLLFPEGTRTGDGRIGPLHRGLALLAARSGASVVPVLIDGAFACWPRHRKLLCTDTVHGRSASPCDRHSRVAAPTIAARGPTCKRNPPPNHRLRRRAELAARTVRRLGRPRRVGVTGRSRGRLKRRRQKGGNGVAGGYFAWASAAAALAASSFSRIFSASAAFCFSQSARDFS